MFGDLLGDVSRGHLGNSIREFGRRFFLSETRTLQGVPGTRSGHVTFMRQAPRRQGNQLAGIQAEPVGYGRILPKCTLTKLICEMAPRESPHIPLFPYRLFVCPTESSESTSSRSHLGGSSSANVSLFRSSEGFLSYPTEPRAMKPGFLPSDAWGFQGENCRFIGFIWRGSKEGSPTFLGLVVFNVSLLPF